MDRSRFEARRDAYRDDLLNDCLPFWLTRSLDREHGGYLFSLERDGSLVDDDKGLLPSAKRPSLTPEQMGALALPTLYLGTELGPAGLSNCVPRASNACRFFEATPSGVPAWLAVLEDFGHMQLIDGYNCVACLTCSRGDGAEHATTQLVARGLMVAFLEATLKARSGYLAYLDGPLLDVQRDNNRVLDAQEQFQFCAEQ